MQNAQTVYLKNIDDLIQLDDLEKAMELLLALDNEAQAGLSQDLTLVKARMAALEKNVLRGFTSPMDADYTKTRNQIRYSLTEMMKDIPRRIELYAQVRNLNTYQFDISTKEVGLEKIIGSRDNLLTISWLEKALAASKAVCKVVREDGESGTGFLVEGGYLFTNNHVLESPEDAAGATLEFNFEVGKTGTVKPLSKYKLDASDFKTSPVPQFDFTKVKVIDGGDKPLKDWGYLEFDPGASPAVGDAVAIIQHPAGGDKRIALRANEVLGQKDQYLYYTTDTEGGSSGSPVFNRDWKVVALHHAAKSLNGRDANEGILFKNILEFLGQ